MYTDAPHVNERKLFGHSIALNPEMLASEYSDRTAENMPRIVTGHIVEDAISQGIVRKEDTREDLLRAGIQDTQTFYECIRTPAFQIDEQLAIASHWKTRRTLAELALESSGNIGLRLGDYGRGGYNFRLSDDGTYITSIHALVSPTKSGCPFAGHNESRTVDPLFTRFNDWTMKLIFAHDHKAKKTL